MCTSHMYICIPICTFFSPIFVALSSMFHSDMLEITPAALSINTSSFVIYGHI